MPLSIGSKLELLSELSLCYNNTVSPSVYIRGQMREFTGKYTEYYIMYMHSAEGYAL